MDLFQVVLLSVLATLTQVFSRPATDKDCKTMNGCTDQSDDNENLVFKLPTSFKNNYSMTLQGYLSFREENFIAVLKGDQDYTITFNYKTNDFIKISSNSDEQETMGYEINILKASKDYTQVQDTEVILKLTARQTRNGNKYLEIIFNGNSSDPSTPISLLVESFDLHHIHFKEGVKNITSIVFNLNV